MYNILLTIIHIFVSRYISGGIECFLELKHKNIFKKKQLLQ